jgi:glyoxylase-like metal-dependent hydrolase (beta-lactamase superfamily II)
MNSSSDCHEIEGCPQLYIDAFKGKFLRKTSDESNTFILTHYHGDHYQSLPREFKYKGAAQIHCTPVTAALLRDVHQVSPEYIVQHAIGETWLMRDIQITFYDANHCPGAAIILIELPNGNHHLHCGDMRYAPHMMEYPLLKQAVETGKMDLIYLDTTYGHPKHDFCPQSEAIEQIASVVEECTTASKSTLILLSCYSIGKEKVLWECSRRAGQPIFVTERKLKMLRCCKEPTEMFTLDPAETDIHVIPMGLAGELWPYFQPNYPSCRDYVEKLEHKKYDKVVAFLPTGWANGSNWNKKNSVVSQSMPYNDDNGDKRLDVEIRLVSYSEHSAFTELIDFVTFLKPRKVIPTVYSDNADRRKIVNHFRNLVDQTRAKQQFFASMKRSPTASVKSSPESKKLKMKVPTAISSSESKEVKPELSAEVQQLIGMGFSNTSATAALRLCKGSLEAAVEHLLTGGHRNNDGRGSADHPVEIDDNYSLPPVATTSVPPSIFKFFSPKKSN